MSREKKVAKPETPQPRKRRSEPKQRDVGRDKKSAQRAYPDAVDDTLDASFPASDPPGWTAGMPSPERIAGR